MCHSQIRVCYQKNKNMPFNLKLTLGAAVISWWQWSINPMAAGLTPSPSWPVDVVSLDKTLKPTFVAA